MSRDSERVASNLVCFILGAAVGAAVALLYAPQEGAETRKLIGDKAQDARAKAEAVAQTAKEKLAVVSEKVHELRRHAPSAEEVVIETAGEGDEDYAV